jgi:hypothetical protein
MLYTRLQELQALEQIDRVSKTGAFAKAMAQGAVGDPVEAAEKIVEHPVDSAVQAPQGTARLVSQVLGGFGSLGKAIGKVGTGKAGDAAGSAKPPPNRQDPIGYNAARNEWARKFGVDPYTTNRPLALKLNHLGMISFSVDKIAGAGVGAATGGLGPIAEYLSYLPDVDEHLLTRPPMDVTKHNRSRLKKLGATNDSMTPLLDNGWFTPPLQTRFVSAMEQLKDAANIGSATELAGNVKSEEQARFVCQSLELLAKNADASKPPREYRTYAGVAALRGGDGTLVAAVPVDLMSWTDVTAGFAQQHAPKDGAAVLCVNGPLTERAMKGFAAEGWKVQH